MSCCVGFWGSLWASDPVVLRSLVRASPISLAEPYEKNTIYILFQQGCAACFQQVRQLKCLSPETKVKLVGVFSPEKELRKEYKKMKTFWPGYYGDQEFLSHFQITQLATPQLLIFGKTRASKILGLTSCHRVLKLSKR